MARIKLPDREIIRERKTAQAGANAIDTPNESPSVKSHAPTQVPDPTSPVVTAGAALTITAPFPLVPEFPSFPIADLTSKAAPIIRGVLASPATGVIGVATGTVTVGILSPLSFAGLVHHRLTQRLVDNLEFPDKLVHSYKTREEIAPSDSIGPLPRVATGDWTDAIRDSLSQPTGNRSKGKNRPPDEQRPIPILYTDVESHREHDTKSAKAPEISPKDHGASQPIVPIVLSPELEYQQPPRLENGTLVSLKIRGQPRLIPSGETDGDARSTSPLAPQISSGPLTPEAKRFVQQHLQQPSDSFRFLQHIFALSDADIASLPDETKILVMERFIQVRFPRYDDFPENDDIELLSRFERTLSLPRKFDRWDSRMQQELEKRIARDVTSNTLYDSGLNMDVRTSIYQDTLESYVQRISQLFGEVYGIAVPSVDIVQTLPGNSSARAQYFSYSVNVGLTNGYGSSKSFRAVRDDVIHELRHIFHLALSEKYSLSATGRQPSHEFVETYVPPGLSSDQTVSIGRLFDLSWKIYRNRLVSAQEHHIYENSLLERHAERHTENISAISTRRQTEARNVLDALGADYHTRITTPLLTSLLRDRRFAEWFASLPHSEKEWVFTLSEKGTLYGQDIYRLVYTAY